MVDCGLIDLKTLDHNLRVKIIDYVQKVKGISASKLGVTPNYIIMIRQGKRKCPDDLLRRALQYLSNEEYAKIIGKLPSVEKPTTSDIIKVITGAKVYPDVREVLFNYLQKYLSDYITSVSRSWIVTEDDVEHFKKVKSMKIKRKTLETEIKYIRLTLSKLNYVLSPEDLQEFLAEFSEEHGDYALKHLTYSLKSFIKTVLKPRDPHLFTLLYFSIYST